MHLTSQWGIYTNTSYEYLAKKFERAILTRVGRDGSEMAVSRQRFFARWRFLASENGLYELVSTFCHVAPDSYRFTFNVNIASTNGANVKEN